MHVKNLLQKVIHSTSFVHLRICSPLINKTMFANNGNKTGQLTPCPVRVAYCTGITVCVLTVINTGILTMDCSTVN
jgi:hypothetical protein